ncbi:hypothetical protein SAMN04489712_11219 [Thermomonospora echinospora]|uniref:Transposase n=1 Tax=Thermomonospora echinospora TaxID=1992 RepID=A0A1H6CZ50_9ACTN|nr:hypothetical protein [Thermomonospora echinospora]SEG78048.1 hypothetical protein SAMN04489712_11219 [Thermomonospora echinospora]
MSRFRFVADHAGVFDVRRLCWVLGVFRSGLYRWLRAAPVRAARRADDARLVACIGVVHAVSG